MITVIAEPKHWDTKLEIVLEGASFGLYCDGVLLATSPNARKLNAWALEKGAASVRWDGAAYLRSEGR